MTSRRSLERRLDSIDTVPHSTAEWVDRRIQFQPLPTAEVGDETENGDGDEDEDSAEVCIKRLQNEHYTIDFTVPASSIPAWVDRTELPLTETDTTDV